ncbi:MAG: electron transfer flavoprotein subunit alpha/FixB family protein [Bacteroidia bacterium]|nr:electron transfer flavoprotein subunit alpha/FixB family protein [Bacteroidia bacterium]
MSVLVFIEHAGGKIKKSSLEALTYGNDLAGLLGMPCIAVAGGKITNDALEESAAYGASKIIHLNNEKLHTFNVQAYTSALAAVAGEQNAKAIVMSASFSAKGMAPRLAVKLNAALADGVISLPDVSSGFKVRKGAFSGKAFADLSLSSDVKVLTLSPNSYKIVKKDGKASVEVNNYSPSDSDLKITVKEIIQATDKVSLPEAELVVSAGRGMKGPENWGMIEELANVLGAATACSKPVSDAGWRPHNEHVGQTGIAISPNLYIAVGISGAIQHLAGVSSSKTIVVINKDAEAPFFKAADYGIVGDAFEVIPKLTEAIKKFKAAH